MKSYLQFHLLVYTNLQDLQATQHLLTVAIFQPQLLMDFLESLSFDNFDTMSKQLKKY